ncbi:hypothetical protein DPMN_008464 [Dreissena polymorpha]|uniref:Uncharacterized protein n=1 Tax=Dreissena polymorpha TaxID=45954 RepID=A0A9D4MZC7_DREPO|nr:hypothetical protein DPMN_008464 [Dreissena polymorpha]
MVVSFMCMILALLFFSRIRGQCRGNANHADLIIAVPGSSKVPELEFQSFEENLIDLLRHFSIEPNEFNIGLILYGENAIRIAAPQPFKTRTQINTRVTLLTQRMQHLHALGSYNNVAKAIEAMIDMFIHPPAGYNPQILRPASRHIGIFFTYGPSKPTNVRSVIEAATKAKAANILMYALAANGTSEDFPQIATDYCRLFSMAGFEDGLPYAIPDLGSGICSELDPAVTVTAENCFPRGYSKAPRIGVSCQVEGNMMQADPNNCAYYFQCEYFDKNPKRVRCALNTLYDPLTFNCNSLENVACYNDLTCPTEKPGLYPHPMECNKYLNCFNDFIPHVQTCPAGQVFDSVNRVCNETASGACIMQH